MEINPITDLQLEEQTIDLELEIVRNQKYQFGDVDAVPASLRPVALEAARATGVTAGAPFSESKLEQTKRALEGKSGLSIVIVTTESKGRQPRIDVLLEAH